jgi:hypothetical protein
MKAIAALAAALVSATPASVHDVDSGAYMNPIEAWRCGDTTVELNKYAVHTYDLVFSDGIRFSGPKSGINFKFVGENDAKLNGKRCRRLPRRDSEGP